MLPIRDAFRNKNGIMWEKFPRGVFFSEDVPQSPDESDVPMTMVIMIMVMIIMVMTTMVMIMVKL